LKHDLINANSGVIRGGIPFEEEEETDVCDYTIATIFSQEGRAVAYMSLS